VDSVDREQLAHFQADAVMDLCVGSWGLTLSDRCANSGHHVDLLDPGERVLPVMSDR
jgi:hypothetical protein